VPPPMQTDDSGARDRIAARGEALRGRGFAPFRVRAAIDARSTEELEAALVQYCATTTGDVVVDGSDLRFIDEPGLTVLVGIERRLRPLGRRLVLRGFGASCREAFERVGLLASVRLDGGPKGPDAAVRDRPPGSSRRRWGGIEQGRSGEMMMRILVVGTVPSAIEPAVAELAGAGHDVVRCHDSGTGPFPCLALSEDRACPLEAGPVDVAVTVRDRAWPRPSPYEEGALCALRRHVPLVVAGTAVLQPFERWSSWTSEEGTNLVAACEQAAAAPLPRHGEVSRDAAREFLAAAGREAGAEAMVWRRRGGLRADITVPAGCADLSPRVAARVTGALRQFDRFATAIDVGVSEAPAKRRLSEPLDGAAPRP
jgi:anti-anti-sigma regulatory factor